MVRVCQWLASRHVVPVVIWSFALVDGLPMLASSPRSGAAVLLAGALGGVLAWRGGARAVADIEAERGR